MSEQQIPPYLWEHAPGCAAQLYPNAMSAESRRCSCGIDERRQQWIAENHVQQVCSTSPEGVLVDANRASIEHFKIGPGARRGGAQRTPDLTVQLVESVIDTVPRFVGIHSDGDMVLLSDVRAAVTVALPYAAQMQRTAGASRDYPTPPNCPFCGGGATMLQSRISCDCCLADMGRAPGETDDQLIASWIRRAP